MLKLLIRTICTIVVMLLVVAASSALGAGVPHSAISHAQHNQSVHRGKKTTGKRHHRHQATHDRKPNSAITASSGALAGDSAVETHLDSLNAGQAQAFPMTASVSDVAGIAHIYIDQRNTASALIVGIYNDSGAHPHALQAVGSTSSVKLGAWNTVSIPPTTLVGGTTYWIAVLGQHGTLRYRDRYRGPCSSETSAQATLRTLSTSWKTGRVPSTCPASAYVTASDPIFLPPAPIEPAPSQPAPSEPAEVQAPALAPTDVTPPTISGTSVEGQVLTVSGGTWNGNPTSYGYQWQDCNSSGESCSNVSQATAPTHTLVASDMGHTVRAVVSAFNATGVGTSTSASVGPVTALPPTASFTYSPQSPVTGQLVTLDGSSSTCPHGPCAYSWSDDGLSVPPAVSLWPLGSGQQLEFTFQEAGTKYLRLVVTDATGQTSTVEHSLVVEEAQPRLTAPSNTALPVISGTPQAGQTLATSSGDWSGSTPMSDSYQWQDCNSEGAACVNTVGATSSSYVLGASDAGHTMRVVVTASNAAGSVGASAGVTGIVTTSGTKGEETRVNCFENPEMEGTARIEACGYPGPHNTGVEQGGKKCSELPSSGSITPAENATIENKDILGTVTIKYNHITLNHVCVISSSERAISLDECTAKNFTIENSTVRGEDATSKPIEVAIANDCRYGEEKLGVAKGDVFEGCGECVHGNWEVDESYIMANKEVQNGNPSSIHREDWYINGNPGAENGAEAIANDDTMFTPDSQTAIIFGDTNNGSGGTPCDNIMTVTNSFVAGSGQMFQTCKSKEAGTSKFLIKNDRFARCLTKPIVAELCTSPYKLAYAPGDSHGYFPLGGRYSVLGTEVPVTWEGNYWDDNLEAVAK